VNHNLKTQERFLEMVKAGIFVADPDKGIFRVKRAKSRRPGEYADMPIPFKLGSLEKHYMRFHLGGRKGPWMYVHVAMWVYFNGLVPKGSEVNHRNTNKLDNRLSNLEILTRKNHVEHTKQHGLYASGDRNGSRTRPDRRPKGEDIVTARLNRVMVRVIKLSSALDPSITEEWLGNLWGVDRSTIGLVRRGKTWRDVP
jgi:hypothetical protein